MNTIGIRIGHMINTIHQQVQKLLTASSTLNGISGKMTEGAGQTLEQSNLTSASEEKSGNMNAVAAAMEQSTANTHIIVSAVEEMTREISQNLSEASTGLQSVNENVNQSSTVSTEITKRTFRTQKKIYMAINFIQCH